MYILASLRGLIWQVAGKRRPLSPCRPERSEGPEVGSPLVRPVCASLHGPRPLAAFGAAILAQPTTAPFRNNAGWPRLHTPRTHRTACTPASRRTPAPGTTSCRPPARCSPTPCRASSAHSISRRPSPLDRYSGCTHSRRTWIFRQYSPPSTPATTRPDSTKTARTGTGARLDAKSALYSTRPRSISPACSSVAFSTNSKLTAVSPSQGYWLLRPRRALHNRNYIHVVLSSAKDLGRGRPRLGHVDVAVQSP